MEIQVDRDTAPEGQGGETPKLVDVRESIRYRRRAQEAERRCAVLEAELEEIRGSQQSQSSTLEDDVAEQRRQRENLERQLDELQTERRLERELIRAGARDPETALLVARERLRSADGTEVDVGTLARDVLEEKPYLKTGEAAEVPPLGRASRGVRPSQSGQKGRAERLATAARSSGNRSDLTEYMRARRNALT